MANYQYDLIVLGGGPAGYAAAIRAAQLKKRVLCVEKENLGGTCLNWGCIPTKALLDSGAFIRKLRVEAQHFGVTIKDFAVDFPRIIQRSREIASRLNKGIAHLFNKYQVKSELGIGQVLAPHKVKVSTTGGTKEYTAQYIIVATGARQKSLPGMEFDGKKIIGSREAMTLSSLPSRLAVIGAGAIGCEFADFYNSMGTEVTIVEFMDHILPNEDADLSILLERSYAKRGMKVMTRSKTERVEKTDSGVRLHVSAPEGPTTVDADLCLLAVGVTGNVDGLFAATAPAVIEKGHIKVDRDNRTSVEDVYAVGDVIGPPWLAHVGHHEAIYCVERIFGFSRHYVDYSRIPGCTYTHPEVASVGMTERQARESGRQIRIGRFPFTASGRALAAGETEGFVKLIFDAKYGELLGAHMIGEGVTELLSELVLAQKLEATEDELIAAMHPHPTLSEAIMEAAGVASGRSIHL